LKAFISYSTADKKVAGQIKSVLEDISVGAFLAHEDINISQEWKERIVQEIDDSDIVIPLLSAEFKDSEWAPQEVGYAYAQGDVLFIPLSIDGTMPFGFISHIQGKRIAESGLTDDLLIGPILHKFPRDLIPRLIERLSDARSFRGAESLMAPLVPFFDLFLDDEIEAFATASIKNGQIWDAADCRGEYLPKFLAIQGSRLSSDQHDALKYQIENGKWHHLREK